MKAKMVGLKTGMEAKMDDIEEKNERHHGKNEE